MRAKLFAVVFAALGLPSAAAAETAQNVLAEAGLLGRWANDCSRPPGGGNVLTIYAAGPAGEVTVSYEHGAAPTVNLIMTARQIAPNRVAYHTQNRATGARLDVIVNVTATQLRVWSSIRSDGQVLVRNGKFATDGVDSPLQTRCN